MKQSTGIFRMLVYTMVCATYLCSIVGFDVHYDAHDNQTYIVSLLQGISCEQIHSDDVCCCCHHHDKSCKDGCCEQRDDCTDNVEQITFTGTGNTNVLHLAMPATPTTVICTPAPTFTSHDSSYLFKETSPPRQRLSEFSILRV